MRAMGLMPNCLALSADITTSAAAPSLIPEAFPAVTVPSFLKAALRPPSFSAVVSALGYSSVSKTISPFLLLIVTGTISCLKAPAAMAFTALLCESAAS